MEDPETKMGSLSAEEQREKDFWETPCAFTPESRLEAHRHLEEKKGAKEKQASHTCTITLIINYY